MSASFFALEWSFATAVIVQDTHRIEVSSSLYVYFSAGKRVAVIMVISIVILLNQVRRQGFSMLVPIFANSSRATGICG